MAAEQSQSIIELRDVSKVYKIGEVEQTALQDISLTISRGEIVAFAGPSGSGKTTLLNIIGAMDRPTTGEVFVDGINLNDLNRKQAAHFRGEHLGFIFQSFNLLPVLTVFENVEYPLVMIKNVPARKRREAVLNLLTAVQMEGHKDKLPDQLSGGQKQRVAVARALVTHPGVVLADEPTANLDGKSAKMVLSLMIKMRAELGVTFVFSTHDPRILEKVDRVYTLEDGMLI
jgi:putative ABC transport system ATP-binding protein